MAYLLDESNDFPPAELADESGVVAVGGDLSVKRLVTAYSQGIFPWYHDGLPILWHSPDPRMVLELENFRVGRSLQKQVRRRPYRIEFDTAFAEVIRACAEAPRPDQDGTWITQEMQDAYIQLFEEGYAHSAEAWDGDTLVGGLYGVALGKAFFGESMFAKAGDASKIAFVELASWLSAKSYQFIDCQMHTHHLERFGAKEKSRASYLADLGKALETATVREKWSYRNLSDFPPSDS